MSSLLTVLTPRWWNELSPAAWPAKKIHTNLSLYCFLCCTNSHDGSLSAVMKFSYHGPFALFNLLNVVNVYVNVFEGTVWHLRRVINIWINLTTKPLKRLKFECIVKEIWHPVNKNNYNITESLTNDLALIIVPLLSSLYKKHTHKE